MQRVRRLIDLPEGIGPQAGRGITVAVLDTGIGQHPDLEGKPIAFRDFVNGRNYRYDDSGHGTHVCGILCGSGAASRGRYRGIAPGVNLVVGKVLDHNGDGKAEDMLAGLKWVLEQRERYHIRILNISVGIGSLNERHKEHALRELLERVCASGITVVCAAGNKGPASGSISLLGQSKNIITVGCHDGPACRNDPRRCETYSGRGQALAPLRKPDVVAPGTDIVSCNVFFRQNGSKLSYAYVSKSGTSMSTPIVSGVAALFYQRNPQADREEFRQKLTLTATDLEEEWNKQGWGMVNVRRLLEAE